MPFYTYILKSLSTGKFYIGHSSNLDQRLFDHNRGHTVSIRGRGPWELVHREEFSTKVEAVQRERQIKAMKSHQWIGNLISSAGG
jgi:putative endonuclease